MNEAERYLYAVRDSDLVQTQDNFGPGAQYREWLRMHAEADGDATTPESASPY
jgi:hypothetical protein